MCNPSKRFFLAYLGVLSILGIIVVFLATSRMGPGVSTDSAMILATAENLSRGRGLVDYRGLELTQFPPLYSLILAAGSLIFRQDVFIVGWILNVLVFGALIWVGGLYFYGTFEDQPILAYFGAFIIFSSVSIIEISANIASDPPFMLIVLLFLTSASAYLKTGAMKHLIMAAALTILGCFQRYAGLSMAITGGLILAFENRYPRGARILRALVFTVVTAAPIVMWGFLHNAPANGTFFGSRLPSIADLNLITGLEKVLYWFIPYRIISAVGALPLAAILVCALFIAVLAGGGRQFLLQIASPQIVPSIAFVFVYGAVLVFDISYYELKGLLTDRVHVIALPALLMILLSVGGHLLQGAKRRFGSIPVNSAAILLFLLWSSYPISKSSEYVSKSMAHGDISPYNSINKSDIRDSSLASYLRNLELAGRTVYSNGGDTAWFLLRAQVSPLPVLGATDRQTELAATYKGWPGPGNGGYIVWINAEAYKPHFATPAELSAIADLSTLYSDETATVYYVQRR
jgi:hypothetical protein